MDLFFCPFLLPGSLGSVLKHLLRILNVGGIIHQENSACRMQVMLGLIGKTLLCFEDSRALEMSLFYPVTHVLGRLGSDAVSLRNQDDFVSY